MQYNRDGFGDGKWDGFEMGTVLGRFWVGLGMGTV